MTAANFAGSTSAATNGTAPLLVVRSWSARCAVIRPRAALPRSTPAKFGHCPTALLSTGVRRSALPRYALFSTCSPLRAKPEKTHAASIPSTRATSGGRSMS
jgi:hypothetical protein